MDVTFGYFAQEKSTAVASERLRDWMSKRLGTKMHLHFAGGYEALGRAMTAGLVDVAWLPPVVFAKTPVDRAEPLLCMQRGGQVGYEAVLVVRADADLDSLGALKGTRAAWVDAWSASGFVVPRVGLMSRGIDPRKLFRTEAFHGSHRAAARAVAEGLADVTGTHARPKADTAGTEEWALVEGVTMRVLHSFGAVPSDLICVQPGISIAQKRELQLAFIEAASGPMKPEVTTIFGVEAFATRDAEDYAGFRQELAKATATGLFS